MQIPCRTMYGPADHSLEVYQGARCVFHSDRHWLHPLFELEEFLASSGRPVAGLVVADKIVGKAAAMILVHLGVRSVRAGMMSRLGLDYLDSRAVAVAYDELVDRIACRTETLLVKETDSASGYTLVKERAGR